MGWSSPAMVGVYSHLTQEAIMDKDLVLHGAKSKKEILETVMEIRKCSCGAENAPIAMYCHECGKVLGAESTREAVQEEVQQVLKEEYPQLVKELSKT